MDRKINTQDMGIFEFVKRLKTGKYLIPSFQREFVWEPCDIIRLWESIYNFYPVGSILFWKTDIKLNIHRKPGGTILNDTGEEKKSEYNYILDGQQRATSLLLSADGLNIRAVSRKEFDHSLFFDSSNRVFFFADEYKKRKKYVDPQFLISIPDLLKTGTESLAQTLNSPDGSDNIKKNLTRLLYALKNYRLPLTCISGFDIPSVSRIFELINREGKALKSMDIMIARSFRNYEYPVEEDF